MRIIAVGSRTFVSGFQLAGIYGQEVKSQPPVMEQNDFPPPPDSVESEVPVAVPFSDDVIPF